MCNFLYQKLPSGWCKTIHLGRSALGVPLLEYLGDKIYKFIMKVNVAKFVT